MTTPPSVQRMFIDGDLEIKTKAGSTGNTLGRIVFTDSLVGDIGSFKVYGFSVPGFSQFRLIHDCSSISRGVSFRTYSGQGGSDEGGTGSKYLVDIQNGYIRLGNYTFIEPKDHQFPTGDFPGLLLWVKKGSATTASYALENDCISAFTTNTLLPDQAQTINVGRYVGYGVSLGYRNAAIPYGFLGMSINGFHTIQECIRLYEDATVEIPGLNLLPLTLDKINNRVGINNVLPTEALDVAGTVRADAYRLQSGSGMIQDGVSTLVYGGGDYPDRLVKLLDNVEVGGDLSAGTLGGTLTTAVQPNITTILPVYLDKVNSRVGINNITPTEALDVTGTIRADAYRLQSGSGMIQDGLATLVYGGGDYPNRVVKLLDKVEVAGSVTSIGFIGSNGAGMISSGDDTVVYGGGSYPNRVVQLADNVHINENLRLTSFHNTEFGYQVAGKETNAGKIWYDTTSNQLYIYGAGSTVGSRVVKIWDNLRVDKDFYTSWINGTRVGTSGTNSVFLGIDAGLTGQGQYAVAVGYQAGQTNQHARSIALNATGSVLNTASTDSCFIKPIRSTYEATQLLTYDGTSGEVVCSPLTEDKTVGTLTADLLAPSATNSRSRIMGTTGLYTVSAYSDTTLTANWEMYIKNMTTSEVLGYTKSRYVTATFAVTAYDNIVVWVQDSPSSSSTVTTRFTRIR